MYTPQNFDHLLGLKGFSEQLLQNHFKLYQGYVINTNKILEALATMEKDGKTATPEYAELKRRFGWEFNGMSLHELYFGNMAQSGVALASDSLLGNELVRVFGSFENWEKDFRAAGGMRGIGWVVLYFDPEAKMFFNVWVNEHDMGHLATAVPLLVLDVFEHAYMLDYGIKKAEYLDAFFKVVNWSVVSDRFMQK